MSISTNFSRNLNTIKNGRGLSVTAFSNELCISRSSLQTILNDNCNLRMDTIDHIASQLNTDPVLLLQEQYSSSQLDIAVVLLDSIVSFSKLSEEDRLMAADLFNQLILLLDNESAEY